MLNVTVLGTGYVGLVTGACLSELGHDVTCIDNDVTKVARLKEGEIPIHEPALDDLVRSNMRQGRLKFTAETAYITASKPDVLFVAVGTPADGIGGADLSYVFAAVTQAAAALASGPTSPDDFTVIVTKSTVPAGTSRHLEEIVAKRIPRHRFAVASNPEFLREGNAIHDFMEPDRIIIGSESARALAILADLYAPLTSAGRRLVATSTVETAELAKYAANALLATKVTFINEMARLCEAIGADVNEVALAVGLDHRIGTDFFSPGPGFGGSCFPKDLRALAKTATDFGSPIEIVETVLRANDRHKQLMVRKIRTALRGSVKDRRIGILGLAFKANTDDMRDAPALTIIPQLLSDGAEVRAYDPVAKHQAKELLPHLSLADSIEDAVAGVDAAVILTEWSAFREISWRELAPSMRRPVVVDLRNLYDPEEMAQHGIEYFPLGRPRASPSVRLAAE